MYRAKSASNFEYFQNLECFHLHYEMFGGNINIGFTCLSLVDLGNFGFIFIRNSHFKAIYT